MKRLLLKACFAVLLVPLSTSLAQASVTLNSTNFPDNNFKAALSPYAVNGVIDETTLTELDVSNQSISNIKGIELLTGLKKFVAAHNNIQFANITNNPNLEWLDLSYNPALLGFNSTSGSGSTTTHWITLTRNMPLKHLDLSNCDIGYFQAIYSGYNINTLTWLSLANDTRMDGWSSGITNQAGLVYCDLSNTGQTSTSIGFTSAHSSLETLILKDNSLNGPVSCLQYLTHLKYLDMSNTGQPQSSSLGLTSANSSLETLLLKGNTSFGWSSSIQHLSSLKYLDISDCDIYFRVGSSPHYLLYYLTPSNNPNLETLISSNSKMGSLSEGLTGFTKLTTVDISGNPNAAQFWVNGSPLLESLNISGDTHLAYLQLNEDALPRTNFAITGASSCTALRSLYLNGNNYASVGQATSDFSSISTLAFLYLENNSGFAGGALTINESDCGNLTGIDLGNNGFTSFTAPSLPATLTALMLGDNPSMTRLEMHKNPGITTMTSSPTMSDGSGLYLLGNTSLTYMDISGTAEQPNYFQRIGNNSSLQGVPIDTIKGSYNKFYTFRNLTLVPGNVYEYWRSNDQTLFPDRPPYEYFITTNGDLESSYRYKSYWPTMPAMPDSASLEQLPNLKYLDLSYCQLKDSVYLHKNTELRYLDVSHNRTIARYTESHDKGAAYRASIPANSTFNRDFPDYKKYLWLATNPDDREYYTSDYNDTTGLYILDLIDNNKLEYVDISYTGIEQTAMTHCHVANARYIWLQDLPNLKYFYADYNGMRSLGIGTRYGKKIPDGADRTDGLRSLERLSVIGMRGTDDRTMQGSINFQANSVCTNLHYINLSYSRFDSIGVYAAQVDTLIIKGNPLHYVNMQSVRDITYLDARECAYKMRGYDVETGDIFFPDINRYQNGAREGGTYSGKITTPLSGLKGVRAYEREKLTTVLLDNSNGLKDVYCHHDPKLPKIHGFENLAYNKPWDGDFGFPTTDIDSLNLVYVNDNAVFNELNLTQNVNLQYLHAYNDKALGTALGDPGLNLTANKNLVTAWVSNSLLRAFTNDAGNNLDTLKIWQNPELNILDVTDNHNLRWFDMRNCMVRDLDLSSNTRLKYFDCSNRDSIWEDYDHFSFTMPGEVPTSMSQPGKNSIADLYFNSDSLVVIHADCNDLYSLKGLKNRTKLNTLTYSYNHINGIDLSGCPNIQTYDCYHNVRGTFYGELAVWKSTNASTNETDDYKMYYLQLVKNAGDAIGNNDTFLGHKTGQDTIAGPNSNAFERQLEEDGFDPEKVISFTVNSSGPHKGNRTNQAPRRADVVVGSDVQPDSTLIYGKIAIIDKYSDERNYIEYTYDDGRPSTSKSGSGSAFGLAWMPPGSPTNVEETVADGLGEVQVVSERYFDVSGVEHDGPVPGVTIIVRQMSDGTTQTTKVVQ